MKRITALTDAIKRVTSQTIEALEVIGKEGYDYEACVERIQHGMQEQVELSREYQKHLDAGTLLQEIEVYTQTSINVGTHLTTEYWRLLPDDDIPHQLSGYHGFFDFSDAQRERIDEWPNAFYVSPECFDESINLSYKQSEKYYSRCFSE